MSVSRESGQLWKLGVFYVSLAGNVEKVTGAPPIKFADFARRTPLLRTLAPDEGYNLTH